MPYILTTKEYQTVAFALTGDDLTGFGNCAITRELSGRDIDLTMMNVSDLNAILGSNHDEVDIRCGGTLIRFTPDGVLRAGFELPSIEQQMADERAAYCAEHPEECVEDAQ